MDGIWLVVLLVLGFSMLFKPEVLWKIEFIGASMIVFIVSII